MKFRPGETVRCKSPEGGCILPNGLQEDAPAKVIATYFNKTYVLYDGKSYLLPNACIHRDKQKTLGSGAEGEKSLPNRS